MESEEYWVKYQVRRKYIISDAILRLIYFVIYQRNWLDTIDTSPEKTPINFQILYKNLPRVQISGHRDIDRRLDFVMRLDEVTGKPIGVAWKNFGYKGPKFHDGFLYGESNSKMEMTGNIYFHSNK